jgi:hypothetical protein
LRRARNRARRPQAAKVAPSRCPFSFPINLASSDRTVPHHWSAHTGYM